MLKFPLFSHPLPTFEEDNYILLKSLCFVSVTELSQEWMFNEINRKLINVYSLISFTDVDLQFGTILAHERRKS